jgi:hypothetical protein
MQHAAFHLYTEDEILALPQPEWLIEPILPKKSLAMLYGPPGVGKSFVALDMGLAIVRGLPWMGCATKRGSVVYVAAEGSAGLTKRLSAWRARHSPSAEQGAVFVLEPVQLLQKAQVGALLAAVRHRSLLPVGLIVLDTLSRCFLGGEENSADDAGLLIAAADELRRETGATVLLIHHSVKERAEGSRGQSLPERGSGALRGAVDTLISLRRVKQLVRLKCEKQKEARSFDSIDLQLVPYADSCVVADAQSYVGDDDSLRPKARHCLKALGDTQGASGATAKQWREKAALAESTFYTYRAELVAGGYVEQRGEVYVLTASGKEAVGYSNSSETLAEVPE